MAKDIIGMRYGRLVVVDDTSDPKFLLCRCDCGKECIVRRDNIVYRCTTSCGCHRSETSKRQMQKINEVNKRYGTAIDNIRSKRPYKNNTSGHRGVSLTKKGKYAASIMLAGKSYWLGAYEHLQDAIDAREKAENELYVPLIKAREAELRV